MAHTPGPWHRHTAYPDRIIVNGSCVYQVHDITTPDGFAANGYGQPNPDDTQLMAAAPYLLKSLKSLLADMEFVCRAKPVFMRTELTGINMDIARDAIAKAEGRVE